MQLLAQEAAWSWSLDECKKLTNLINIKRENRSLEFENGLLFSKLRLMLELEMDADKTMNCLVKLRAMGAEIPFAFVSSDLIPVMLNLHRDRDRISGVAQKLKDACPFISWPL